MKGELFFEGESGSTHQQTQAMLENLQKHTAEPSAELPSLKLGEIQRDLPE